MKSGRSGWYDSYNEGQRGAHDELALISRDGCLHATSGRKRTKPMLTNDVEEGTYVPDTVGINICLNCKKKKCTTGNCALITQERRRLREERMSKDA